MRRSRSSSSSARSTRIIARGLGRAYRSYDEGTSILQRTTRRSDSGRTMVARYLHGIYYLADHSKDLRDHLHTQTRSAEEVYGKPRGGCTKDESSMVSTTYTAGDEDSPKHSRASCSREPSQRFPTKDPSDARQTQSHMCRSEKALKTRPYTPIYSKPKSVQRGFPISSIIIISSQSSVHRTDSTKETVCLSRSYKQVVIIHQGSQDPHLSGREQNRNRRKKAGRSQVDR